MSANPTIANLQYSPGCLTVFWNANGGNAFTLRVTDTTKGTSTSYPATGFTVQIKATLAPADSWTVAIACTDGGTTGPYSPAVPILTNAPAVTGVLNQLTQIVAQWSAPAGYAGQYAVTLQVQGQQSQSETVSGLSKTFSLAQAPAGNSTTVSVQLQQTVNQAATLGPATTYTVVTNVPVMASVNYGNGKDLVLTWSPMAGYGFKAVLQSSTGTATPVQTASNTCTFTGPLTGATFTASLSATSADYVSVGPPTAGYAALTQAPSMVSVVNTGAGVNLAWSPLAGSSAYQAVLQVPGQSPAFSTPTAAQCVFNGPLGTPESTCWVSGTASNGVVLGPPSAVYTVLVGRPLWVLAAYDAGQMGLSWTAVTDKTVSGYLITIAGLTPSAYPVGNATSKTVSAILAPLTSYPTTVAATNGIVEGPPSPTLIPLTAPPLVPNLGYTGAALRLSWAPSGEGGVTGYAVELMSNGASSETKTPTASPQNFTTAFASGVAYTARARSSGPGTLGPWCASATGPYQAQLAYVYDSQGRIASIAWAAGFTEAYAFDSAGNLLSASYSPTPAAQPQG
jgi:YD repeat-containing protein